MPEIGRHHVRITSNALVTLGDKNAIRINFEYPDGEAGDTVIFLTEKSAGIARASLKACGFDPDAEDLAVLEQDEVHLANREVDILVEPYNGKLQAKILLRTSPPSGEVKKMQDLLRGAKKRGEDGPIAAPAKPPAPKGEPYPGKAPPAVADLDLDDIPF